MSMPFLALWNQGHPRADRMAPLAAIGEAELVRRFEGRSVTVFAPAGGRCLLLPDDLGLILGPIFRSGGAEPVREFSSAEAEGLAADPRRLNRDWWGSYVAFLAGTDGWTIVRDPSGGLPLYHAPVEGGHAFASSAELLIAAGMDSGLDEPFVAHWLLYPHLRTERTGFAAARELLPGTALTLAGRTALTKPLWSPLPWTRADRRIDDFDSAARALRSTLTRCVPALVSASKAPYLVELSGGLDSSIVGAALAARGVRCRAVNFATRTPDGDERVYARAVATKTGAPLAELVAEAPCLDLTPTPPRLRPSLSPVLRPIRAAFEAHARERGAATMVSGGGGDSLFCYLNTAAPAVDALLAGRPGTAVRALGDVAAICGCTFWTAGRFAARKLARLNRLPGWRSARAFLDPSLLDLDPDPHPWLAGLTEMAPGKREHVVSLVTILDFIHTEPERQEIPRIYPLMAQPLVELCLAIPTWLWAKDGRNRAVARAAFADRLPAELLNRRGKGRLESFCATAFDRSRPALRALLLEGSLARRRLIDRAAVETYLAAPPPLRDPLYFRLFDLAAMELWLSGAESLRPAKARARSAPHRSY